MGVVTHCSSGRRYYKTCYRCQSHTYKSSGRIVNQAALLIVNVLQGQNIPVPEQHAAAHVPLAQPGSKRAKCRAK